MESDFFCGAERCIDGSELVLEGGSETWAIGRCCDGAGDLTYLFQSGFENGAVRVGLEGDDEVEEVGDGALSGSGERPLIAEEADALGWGKGGLGVSGDNVELVGSVLSAVVALVVGVGEEERPPAGMRKSGVSRVHDPADGFARGFQTYRNGPVERAALERVRRLPLRCGEVEAALADSSIGSLSGR